MPMPLEPIQPGGKAAFLRGGKLYGRMLDNVANQGREGAGFNPLCHADYPGKPIFTTTATGLNFEHIFNGVTADNARAMFTPRKDPVVLTAPSEREATLYWPAERSAWGMECLMHYTLVEPDMMDMEFTAKPTQEHWGHGYAAMMWADYMGGTRDRRIYFYGTDGAKEGWLAFGEDTPEGFETGTVACAGVAPLPYDTDAQALNIKEHPTKRFIKPVYYGLMDGDHDFTTTGDTLAFILMFDQTEPIRFALWNFIKDDSGKPDTHRPAWDWQYVIHKPEIGREYGYRARLIVRPFTSREDVLAAYESWAKSLSPR